MAAPMARMSLTLDVGDREALAAFWCAALGYRVEWSVDRYTSLVPAEGDRPKLLLQEVPESKTAKNGFHLDLHFEDFEAQAADLSAAQDRSSEVSSPKATGDDRSCSKTRRAT